MPPPLGRAPIESILSVDYLTGPPLGEVFTASSLPGHLLHFVTHGGVRQQCNGRTYDLRPGMLLWYHEDEWVEGAATAAPWQFYSINFIAPSLPPPPFEARLFEKPDAEAEPLCAALLEAWSDGALSPSRRLLRVHSLLLALLDKLQSGAHAAAGAGPEANLWWKLELEVRRDLSRPVSLNDLERWSGCSAATIARAAQAAVGQTPMRRIKQIRLSFARGLVQRSGLSFGEIAARTGYARVHEFSRDYKAVFGTPPSADPERMGSK